MSAKATSSKGTYLYAFIEGNGNGSKDGPKRPSYGAIGLEGSEVHEVRLGAIAAVVSEVSSRRLRPQRSNLAAHQGVLKELMKGHTVLPISFGMIAEDRKAVEKLIGGHRDALTRELQRVAGKVEMGLRVTWDVPNIFEYFVNTHDSLRKARDRLLGGGREATQEEMIEMGSMFGQLLDREREVLSDKVEGVLSDCSSEIKRNKPRNERDVMNLACLIGRDQGKHFESCVFEAAKLFDDNYAFDYNGPWAPHNFVEVDLQT